MYGNRRVIASGTPDLPTCCSSMAVPNQAASIWSRSTPASCMASSKASTIRSSALASQRSPNLEQPIPRMTILSLIPVAMVVLSSLVLVVCSGCRSLVPAADVPAAGRWSLMRARHRRRLPEVPHEAACSVDVLDPEHHAHRRPDLDRSVVDVGEVYHHPASSLELDH